MPYRFDTAVRTTGLHLLARLRWAALLATAVLSGCNNSRPATESGQVAAIVNRNEITVHQVDLLLPRTERQPGEPAATVGQRALGSLIDQELAAQAARAGKLDREPSVIQTQQAAAREVLARAYLERVASEAVAPDSLSVDSYYESRPELFSRRRIYSLQEFVATGGAGLQDQIPALSREARSADDLQARMSAIGLKVASHRLVRAAEDLPEPVLKQLAAAAPGHAVIVPGREVTRILFVHDAVAAPVDRRAAGQAIARVLLVDAQRKLVEQRLEELRQAAEIDYRGTFAQARREAQTTPGGPGL